MDRQTFLNKCNADAGLHLKSKPLDAYMHDYPTLAQVDDMFGCANLWMEAQYTQLLLTLPQKVYPTDAQISEATKVMRSAFSRYTIAEILLFFAKIRTGDYICYNRGNIQEILELFHSKFLPLRSSLIDDAERTKSEKERENIPLPPEGYSSREWYEELLRRAKSGDQEALRELTPPDGDINETIELIKTI